MTARRVLTVDDDPAIRALVRTVLTRAEFAVEEADNGAQAIDLFKTKDYDAVLLDLMMPMVSGFEVLDWMKTERPDYARRCVIVFSAAAEKDLKKIDPETVYAVIQKPFDITELVRVLEGCIGQAGR